MKKAVGLTLLSMACVSLSCFAEASDNQSGRLLNTVLKRFEAVSCDKTATQCIALGFGAEYHMHERLAYMSQDGGLTWSAPAVLPLPKEVDKTQVFENDSLLIDISCDKTSVFCTIAGTLAGSTEAVPLIYSTNNGGESWKAGSLKLPSYQAPSSVYHGTFLTGVSCNYSGLSCVVVGNSIIMPSYFGDFYGNYPISYYTQDGGNHWSKPFVLEKNEMNDINKASTFADVACDSAGLQCTAVGYINDYRTSTSKPFSLTSKNGGEDWEKLVFIIPQDGRYLPNSISCDSSGRYCVVVGYESKFINTIPVQRPFVYTTNNTAVGWEKNVDKTFPNWSMLNDIFCNNEADRCLAVGIQADANNAIALKRNKNLFSLHRFQVSKK